MVFSNKNIFPSAYDAMILLIRTTSIIYDENRPPFYLKEWRYMKIESFPRCSKRCEVEKLPHIFEQMDRKIVTAVL